MIFDKKENLFHYVNCLIKLLLMASRDLSALIVNHKTARVCLQQPNISYFLDRNTNLAVPKELAIFSLLWSPKTTQLNATPAAQAW